MVFNYNKLLLFKNLQCFVVECIVHKILPLSHLFKVYKTLMPFKLLKS